MIDFFTEAGRDEVLITLRMHIIKSALALAFVVALSAPAGRAQTLVFHHGATNPQLEGWNRGISGFPYPTAGAVLDQSIEAWEVNKTIADSSLTYSYTIGEADLLAAKQKGWSFSFSLFVAEYPSPADGSIYFQVNTNGEVWNAKIGATEGGAPILQFGYGSYPAYNLSSGGGEYHDYELIYNPIEGNLDLYIDGIVRMNQIEGGVSGGIPATGTVSWGASGFTGTGSGHWSSVEFSIIPEPASFGIYAGALSIMISCLSRKVRRRS